MYPNPRYPLYAHVYEFSRSHLPSVIAIRPIRNDPCHLWQIDSYCESRNVNEVGHRKMCIFIYTSRDSHLREIVPLIQNKIFKEIKNIYLLKK